MLRQVNYSLVEFRLILLLTILHGFPANNWRIYYGAQSRVSSASTLPPPSLEAGGERLSQDGGDFLGRPRGGGAAARTGALPR